MFSIPTASTDKHSRSFRFDLGWEITQSNQPRLGPQAHAFDCGGSPGGLGGENVGAVADEEVSVRDVVGAESNRVRQRERCIGPAGLSSRRAQEKRMSSFRGAVPKHTLLRVTASPAPGSSSHLARASRRRSVAERRNPETGRNVPAEVLRESPLARTLQTLRTATDEFL